MCDRCKPISRRGKVTVYSPASADTLDLNNLMRGCRPAFNDDFTFSDAGNYAQTKEDQNG